MKKIDKQNQNKKHLILAVLVGVLGGLVIFALLRLLMYSPQHTHYHANFSVYINGVQEKFSSPLYYQEVASCSKDKDTDPLHRAHMHDEVFDIVHVHAPSVTWSHFFENININTDTGYLRIGGKVYTNNETSKVSYLLNGKQLSSLSGQSINSEDTILINYGNEDVATINSLFTSLSNKAHEYNLKKDPASCSGNEDPALIERFKHIF
ncbi:hypothetical protein H0W80_04665 [Candidatus Saccharibacteria bacterium]|nr:hypothetical protein [Candidatus Saccharibacteria bacterium]